jgi:hypothetical protein
MYELGITGVWQDACDFAGPFATKATSTLQTLHEPNGSRLGASHSVTQVSFYEIKNCFSFNNFIGFIVYKCY